MKIYVVITNRWMPDSAFDLSVFTNFEQAEMGFAEECGEGSAVYPVITELHEINPQTGESSVLRKYDSQDSDPEY